MKRIRRVISIFSKRAVIGVVLGLSAVSNVFAYKDAFNPEHLSVGHKVIKRPTKINILGDEASELIVVGVGDNREKMLTILGYDAEYDKTVILKSFELNESIYAWDHSEGDDDKLQNIYLLGKNQIYVIDESLTLKPLTDALPQLNSMFLTDESDTFVQQDFVKDLNKDGVDDFVLPYFTQVSVWLSEQTQYRYQALPIPSVMEAGSRDFVFRPRKLYFAPFSQQGTIDIAVVEKGNILYYSIDKEGKYGVEPTDIALNENIYGEEWWNLPGNDLDGADHTNVTHRSIISIRDINGDGIPDVAVDVAVSESLLSKTNDFEFYFGRLVNGEVVYSEQSQSRVSTGATMTPNFIDIDGDNKKELLVTSFKLSLSKIIGVLISGSADIDVFVFGLKDGVYASKPIVSKSVDMRINLSSGIQTLPMIEMLDIDGNQIEDLLLSDEDDEIKIHLAEGEVGSSSYARRGTKFDFDMPRNADRILDADIDGNGKDDLVITYTKTDGDSKVNTVTVLYAK